MQYMGKCAVSMVYCDGMNSKNSDTGLVCGVWNCSPKLVHDSIFSCDFTCNSEMWESLLVYSVHNVYLIFLFCRYRLFSLFTFLIYLFRYFPFYLTKKAAMFLKY